MRRGRRHFFLEEEKTFYLLRIKQVEKLMIFSLRQPEEVQWKKMKRFIIFFGEINVRKIGDSTETSETGNMEEIVTQNKRQHF